MQPQPSLQELEEQTMRELAVLRRDLAESPAAAYVEPVGRYHLRRLLAHATVTDFIPLFVYRATKDDLLEADVDATGLQALADVSPSA